MRSCYGRALHQPCCEYAPILSSLVEHDFDGGCGWQGGWTTPQQTRKTPKAVQSSPVPAALIRATST